MGALSACAALAHCPEARPEARLRRPLINDPADDILHALMQVIQPTPKPATVNGRPFDSDPAARGTPCPQAGFSKSIFQWMAVLLCMGAWWLRMVDSDSPARDFWTMRQYSSAMIARQLYYDMLPSVPEWKQEVLQGGRRWHAEPPIMEYLASRIFRLQGRESFWPFRLITASGWVLGGWFLFLILRRLLGAPGALAGLAFFLFVPFGITTSVALHADPLMIMGLLASTWAILRYCDHLTGRHLVFAGLLSGVGLVFKPGPVVFLMGTTFGLCLLAVTGWNRKIIGRSVIFAILTVLPSFLVNLWAVQRGLYQPGYQLSTYWSPHLLGTLYFWRGWLGRVIDVLTVPGLLLAVAGVFGVRTRLAWAVLAGWGGGYLLQSLLCSYTTPSHDYWHMHVIPMAALCIGALVAAVFKQVGTQRFGAWGLWGTLLVAMVASGVVFRLRDIQHAKRRGHSAEYIRMADAIGQATNHSANTILLDYDYSAALKYFAWIDGKPWPWTGQMVSEQALGNDTGMSGELVWHTLELDAHERYERFYADRQPEYFVICRLMGELDLQPGLRSLLADCPLVVQTPRYAVYDLRHWHAP